MLLARVSVRLVLIFCISVNGKLDTGEGVLIKRDCLIEESFVRELLRALCISDNLTRKGDKHREYIA